MSSWYSYARVLPPLWVLGLVLHPDQQTARIRNPGSIGCVEVTGADKAHDIVRVSITSDDSTSLASLPMV